MAKAGKFDGVIEAVHYNPQGMIRWVRAYERRGATFSDHVLIQRPELIERLAKGKTFVAGRRVPQMASTFEVSSAVRLVRHSSGEVILSGAAQGDARDDLADVPVI
jgi:hypothetical protein